jgi:16S rRNA (adenine1518-N6/adenine1519-N6)-dimethyltransferase
MCRPAPFRPAPKVMSSIVRMVPRPAGRVCTAMDYALLGKVVTAAFGQRRKTLRNTLRDYLDEADFVGPRHRPGPPR